MPPKKTRKNNLAPQGIRIIAGQWRGRRLPVLNSETLRPTPNRVKETLFNWLAPYIQGAQCLDLYAGSGSLAFEALSRGADAAWLIEQKQEAIQYLKKNQQRLSTQRATVVQYNCLEFLKTPPHQTFDIVFIDPPYADNLLEESCSLLDRHAWLKPHALIYLEFSHKAPAPKLPDHWTILKEKHAATVNYWLVQNALTRPAVVNL